MLTKILALKALISDSRKDTFVPLKQSEYNALVETGKVEENVYYLIVGDDE